MRVIAKKTLRTFWESEKHNAAARKPLEAWHAEAEAANWATPNDVKEQFGSASVLKGGRIVFNIGGNNYRLIVSINYPAQIIYICWVGTHEAYNEVDAETVRCI